MSQNEVVVQEVSDAEYTREYGAWYRARHREEQRARDAIRYAADPEGQRARVREYMARNREAVRARNRQRRQADPEKANAEVAAWRKANPEKVKAYSRQRWLDHGREQRAYSEKWRAENPERVREQRRAWHKANPGKRAVYEQRRRAAMLASPGRGVTAADWRAVVEDSIGLCAYCARPTDNPTMDHIEPLVKGGAHDPDNIVAACRPCNSSKWTHSLVVWLALGGPK